MKKNLKYVVVLIMILSILFTAFPLSGFAASDKPTKPQLNLIWKILYDHNALNQLYGYNEKTGKVTYINFDISKASNLQLCEFSAMVLPNNDFPKQEKWMKAEKITICPESGEMGAELFSKSQVEKMSILLFGKKPTAHGARSAIDIEYYKSQGFYLSCYHEGDSFDLRLTSYKFLKNKDLQISANLFDYDSDKVDKYITAVFRPANNQWGYILRSITYKAT